MAQCVYVCHPQNNFSSVYGQRRTNCDPYYFLMYFTYLSYAFVVDSVCVCILYTSLASILYNK